MASAQFSIHTRKVGWCGLSVAADMIEHSFEHLEVPMTALSEAPQPTAERAACADPAAMPLERVEAELCTLAGQVAAATSRFLALLADFDAREGWGGWGVHS
jgi:hypothetical protein